MFISDFKGLTLPGDTDVDSAHYNNWIFKDKEVMAYLQAGWIKKAD